MLPALILVHAVIGLLAVLSSRMETDLRGRSAQGLAVAGGGFALILFFATPWIPESWRTLEVGLSGARVAGIAVAAAWILIAVGERSRGGGRWDLVACTGVASTALLMFALNAWTIPALLFAGIAALATAMSFGRDGVATSLVAVGIAFVGAALIWDTMDAGTWELALPLSEPRLWLAVVGAVAFAAAAIVTDPFDRPLPSTPLVLGLSFVTLGSVARAAGPVVAVVLTALALLAVIRTLTKDSVSQRVVLVWVVALSVALASLTGDLYVTTRCAVAGILAASVIRLWPLSRGRAQIERGILIAFVAMTAGFNAIAAAASYSFERSTSIERVLDAAPWAVMSALLPAALAGGVVLGASVARNPEPEDYSRSGVLGSWSLVLLTIAVGVFPFVGAGEDAGLSGPGLYVVALLAGVAAARYLRLSETTSLTASGSRFFEAPLGLQWPGPAVLATRGLAAATGLAIIAATFQGLRLGFL